MGPEVCLGCNGTSAPFNADGYCESCSTIIEAWRATIAEQLDSEARDSWEREARQLYRQSLQPLTDALWAFVEHEIEHEPGLYASRAERARDAKARKRDRKGFRRLEMTKAESDLLHRR